MVYCLRYKRIIERILHTIYDPGYMMVDDVFFPVYFKCYNIYVYVCNKQITVIITDSFIWLINLVFMSLLLCICLCR